MIDRKSQIFLTIIVSLTWHPDYSVIINKCLWNLNLCLRFFLIPKGINRGLVWLNTFYLYRTIKIKTFRSMVKCVLIMFLIVFIRMVVSCNLPSKKWFFSTEDFMDTGILILILFGNILIPIVDIAHLCKTMYGEQLKFLKKTLSVKTYQS